MNHSMDVASTMTRESSAAQTGLLPVIVALVYPAALHVFFSCETALKGSSTAAPILWAGILVSLALAFGAPFVGLYTAQHAAGDSVFHRRLRVISYLVVAAPPLFTLIGVYFDFLIGIANSDYVVWGFLWTALGAWIVFSGRDPVRVAIAKPALAWLRVTHGISALAIVLLFLAAHLVNHVAGILSGEAHIAVMKVLRVVYRNDYVQPILLALFAVQVISGGWLLSRHSPKIGDGFKTLQAASGVFLAVFIASHTTAVFVVGRRLMNADTNWEWLTGAPFGMLADPWSVRLIPHYTLAVSLATAHLACGLRTVLVGHNVALRTASQLAFATMFLGAVGAVLTISGMLGFHIWS